MSVSFSGGCPVSGFSAAQLADESAAAFLPGAIGRMPVCGSVQFAGWIRPVDHSAGTSGIKGPRRSLSGWGLWFLRLGWRIGWYLI